MERFDTCTDAKTFLDAAVLFNDLSDKGNDYLLIGRYYDQAVELDMEGFIAPHAGLTLPTASNNGGHGHEYHELQSLTEPATRQQYFFAGLRNGRLVLFDQQLQPTLIDKPQIPFPNYYHHAYLTFKNSNDMNQSSYEYNRTQLLNLGFGEEIAKPLFDKIQENLAEFTLDHVRKFGKDEVHSTLHFSKGDDLEKDLTFFNRFDSTLKQDGKEDLTQTFYVGTKYNYTLQERYNMMDGRAAYREQPKMIKQPDENGEEKMKPSGETYFAWRGLDFKNADQYGNFNPKIMFWEHQKEVAQYPIKGIEENYNLQRLLGRLEKGNKVDVVLLRNGQETPAQMLANPRMMRIEFYDSAGEAMSVRKSEKQAVEQTQKTDLTPQEVQRAAIARGAEQKQAEVTGQMASTTQNVNNSHKQDNERIPDQGKKEAIKEQAAEQQQGQRRKQGVRV